ncbi:MAG: serine/threonine protein kinase [Candidatus Melainabacteria bacterium]|jgi:tRNA A-37 threonylcarbamoyl transferase component Bud32|nr:serine/threonine protein kinase [Candidatus Melainabacteria bacterium]
MPDESESTASLNSSSVKGGGLSSDALINEKYQVVSLIGSGGMGTVYRVHQVFLGKEFALKLLDLHNRSDVSVRRFQQEARTASQLQHPNLVEVHDFGMIDGEQPYLVMDLVEGETLAQLLKTKVSLPIDYVVALSIQVCFGLMYAHAKGVVHRDIKPANILLLYPESIPIEGTVKIVDFGIAKLTQSEDGQIQSLTQTGEIFGSPLYMSPEQCKGTAVDRRSDIYSLGCVMFESLTGSPPFYGETAMATMLKRLSEAPVSLKEGSLGAEFPAQLENIVRRMLKVEPNERYQDFKDVIKDLVALQRSSTGSTPVIVEQEKAVVQQVVQRAKINASQQAVLMLMVALAAFIATSVFDRMVTFPALLEAREREKEAALEAKKQALKKFDIPIMAERKPEDLVDDNDRINRSLNERPRIEIKEFPGGRRAKILYFPTQTGKISINNKPRIHAFLEVEIPENAELDLRLNHVASQENDLLQDVTSLNFTTLGYHNDAAVNNDDIQIMSKLKNLKAVVLDGTGVTSLSCLYDAQNLNSLEVAGAYVPPSEILKVKRLPKLKTLAFGPVDDATGVFNELAKSNNIAELRYFGARFTENGPGRGLTDKELTALSKLTNLVNLTIDACPSFKDTSVKKLIGLKKLRHVRIRDCGLTANAWKELRYLKSLSLLEATMVGWTPSEKQLMMRLPYPVAEALPRAVRQQDRAWKTKSYEKLFDL